MAFSVLCSTCQGAATNFHAVTALPELVSSILPRLSALIAPAPNAEICKSRPAIVTFMNKRIRRAGFARTSRR